MYYSTKNKYKVIYLHLLGINYDDIIEEYSNTPLYVYYYIPSEILEELDNYYNK